MSGIKAMERNYTAPNGVQMVDAPGISVLMPNGEWRAWHIEFERLIDAEMAVDALERAGVTDRYDLYEVGPDQARKIAIEGLAW